MNNLKELRNKAGLSQLQLAAKVGVSIPTIRSWENNVTTPKPENKEKLKKVLEEELEE